METTSIRVLLVEDSLPDRRLLNLMLGEDPSHRFELTEADRLATALTEIAAREFSVILADLSLPDSQGLNTFTRLHTAAPNVPILILSGLDDERVAVTAVREGAQDYLVKGKVDNYLLTRAISHAIERHHIERVLHDNETLYRQLLESITDYRFSVEVQNGHPSQVIHGPGCVAVTGYAPEHYAADPDLWLRLVEEQDRHAVAEAIARVLGGEMPPAVEHRIRHRSGTVRWVRLKVVPRKDKTGHLTAYDGLISDITERKVAEENLVTSEAFYHSLVENIPQNILRKDRQERFTFANKNFCNMLGKPLEQIIGKTDFDFYSPELAAKYQRDDQQVIASGKTFETIEENQASNGETIFVNVIKTPIRDANGQVIGIQGIFWDITERKRFEEQLQKANRELARSEADLRKSHEDLRAAQSQLIQAEKMESIGTLAAGVAHEVKNPLAILMMGVNYLAKRLGDADQNMALVLREMHDAINRADSITRGLLDFSAPRGLSCTVQDLNALIGETLALVRHELSSKRIKVNRQWGDDLLPVRIDKTQIQQVFINVFLNAIHAMPVGGTLTIRTYLKRLTETVHFEGSRNADRFWIGDRAVVAEVDDTGPGISEQFLAKVFDPFFTTKPTGVGTGLGLSVSRKIIELHGGTVDLNNLPAGGLRVTVMLKPHREQTQS